MLQTLRGPLPLCVQAKGFAAFDKGGTSGRARFPFQPIPYAAIKIIAGLCS
jgi:hypothetical protein